MISSWAIPLYFIQFIHLFFCLWFRLDCWTLPARPAAVIRHIFLVECLRALTLGDRQFKMTAGEVYKWGQYVYLLHQYIPILSFFLSSCTVSFPLLLSCYNPKPAGRLPRRSYTGPFLFFFFFPCFPFSFCDSSLIPSDVDPHICSVNVQ
jgi:hypothetical protein